VDERVEEALRSTQRDLVRRAFLYDEPTGYREGVDAALEAVRLLLAGIRDAA
jgi:hypothetical protein